MTVLAVLSIQQRCDLAQRFPKAQRPIPNSEGRPLRQSAALEVEREFFPRLLALAVAIPQPQQSLMVCEISTNNDQITVARCFKPGLKVQTIDQKYTQRLPERSRRCHWVNSSYHPCSSRLTVACESPGAPETKRASEVTQCFSTAPELRTP
jgi:hypothetical protein